MPPTRFPYGQAAGFVNQFQFGVGPTASGTAGLLGFGDATPDVTVGDLFVANNTAATTITYFDLQNYAQRAQDYFGKVIRVLVVDQGSTNFANSGELYLQGSNNLTSRNAYALYEFMHVNSAWIQVGNANQNRREVTTFTIAAQSSIQVEDVKTAIVTNTGAGSIFLSAFSGGQVGQHVTLMAGTGGISLFVQTGGNIAITGTNAYLISVSGAYQFVKRASDRWSMLHIGSTGIA